MAKKLMIIDDHLASRQLVRQASATSLDTVLEFASPEEAMKVLHAFQPDCVMLGISCPPPRARDVIRDIRKKMPEVRVLAVNNLPESEMRQAVANAGANGCVSLENLSELFLLAAPERLQMTPLPRSANTAKKSKKSVPPRK